MTPEAYGYFTHWLSALANGKVIVCLEGGYNVNSISYAMAACTKALLGDPLPMLLTNKRLNASCVESIQNVLSVQQKYWRSLRFNKKLPNFDIQRSPIDDLYREFNKVNISENEAKDGDTNSGKKNDSSPGTSRDVQPSTSTATASGGSAAKTLTEFLAENKNVSNMKVRSFSSRGENVLIVVAGLTKRRNVRRLSTQKLSTFEQFEARTDRHH